MPLHVPVLFRIPRNVSCPPMAANVSARALRSAILQCLVADLMAMELWAWAECSSCHANREIVLQLLAASYPETKLVDLLPRLRCSSCGARPSRVVGLDTRGRQIGLLGSVNGGGGRDRGGRLPDVAAQWGMGNPREKTDVR